MANLTYLLSKVGKVKPATKSKAIEIIEASEKAGHAVRFVWGMGAGGEHGTGNALDIMVGDSAAGDFVRNYVWANRARLRLRHVIWSQHITSTVVSPGVRRSMADRGNSTTNHMDHNHILFLDAKAYVAPSGSKPAKQPVAKSKPATPSPQGSVLRIGSKGATVSSLQRQMNSTFPAYIRLSVDGNYGPNTAAAVTAFQHRAGFAAVNVDGVVGPMTRAKLREYGIVV